jgi:hypothetical protein
MSGGQFYALIGYCINQWAYVDQTLADFCHHALGSDLKRSFVVYYYQNGFGSRLNLVSKLLSTHELSDEHAQIWKRLRDKLQELAGFRNAIAHSPVRSVSETRLVEDGGQNEGEPRYISQSWWEVYSEQNEVLTGKKEKIFTQVHVMAHLSELQNCHQQLVELLIAIGGTQTQLPGSPQSADPLP